MNKCCNGVQFLGITFLGRRCPLNQPRVKSGKKAYEAPRLNVHGDIRELTKATGNQGASDGGVKTRKRTS
jgi:hypothetical protein